MCLFILAQKAYFREITGVKSCVDQAHFVVGFIAAVILQWFIVVVLTMTAFVVDIIVVAIAVVVDVIVVIIAIVVVIAIVVASTVAIPFFRDVVVLGDNIVWIVSIVTMDWKLL